MTVIPLEFLTLGVIYTESLAICQLQLRLSYPGTGFRGGFCLCVSATVSCDSLCLPICVSILGAVV